MYKFLLIYYYEIFFSYRIHSIIICVEACLFGLFVATMLFDQIQSIISDRSLIDNLKLDEAARNVPQMLPPARVLLRKVFGSGKRKTHGK